VQRAAAASVDYLLLPELLRLPCREPSPPRIAAELVLESRKNVIEHDPGVVEQVRGQQTHLYKRRLLADEVRDDERLAAHVVPDAVRPLIATARLRELGEQGDHLVVMLARPVELRVDVAQGFAPGAHALAPSMLMRATVQLSSAEAGRSGTGCRRDRLRTLLRQSIGDPDPSSTL
jgi:hypothetical protein